MFLTEVRPIVYKQKNRELCGMVWGDQIKVSLGLPGFKSWLSYSRMEQLLSFLGLGFPIRRKEMIPTIRL